MKRRSAAVLIVSMTGFTTACVVIEDGEVGVSKSFGVIADEPLPAGVAFVAPVVRQVETWNVKLQELKESAQVPSSEGLIVGLQTSLLFQVVPERAPEIRKTVGRAYIDGLVVPYFRSALRDVVSGYPVKQIYTEVGRKSIAEKIPGLPRGEPGAPRDRRAPARREAPPALQGEHRGEAHGRAARGAAAVRARAGEERRRDRGRARRGRRPGPEDRALDPQRLVSPVPKTLNENPNVIYVSTEANLPIFKSVAGK